MATKRTDAILTWMSEEQALVGRVAGATRVGSTVRKRVAPWTSSVDAMLDHLARRGFDGAPRALGRDDQGRQILSWIEGSVPGGVEIGSSWTSTTLEPRSIASAASLLASMHAALADFDPIDPCWMHAGRRRLLAGEIVGHGDVGPWNLVYRAGLPVALIDFDSAGPTTPILEAAQAAWALVPLVTADMARRYGIDPDNDVRSRLALFAEAYGVGDAAEFLAALTISPLAQLSHAQHWAITAAEAASHLRSVSQELDMLENLMPELTKEFGVDAEAVAAARARLARPAS